MAAAFDPSKLFSLQAGQIPPDQAQLQAQAQNQVAGIPAYLTPNQPPPQAADTTAPQAPGSSRPNMFMNAGGSTPQGIKAYLPVDNAASGYKKAAAQSRLDQDANLDDIQKYINDLKAKGQGVDWSPLAALADSMSPGKSNLLAAAKETAPMSSDERDKMLANLQMSLGKERNQASQESLSAMAQQMNYEKQQQQMAETARHNSAIEAVGMGRNDVMGGRVKLGQDNQIIALDKMVINDPQLKTYVPRIQGADRILGQLGDVRAGKMVDTNQFLNDINTEYVNLLTGANNSALGKQERTEYSTAAGKLASVQQQLTAHPESINSPDILKQIETGVKSLKQTYQQNYDARAGQLKVQLKNNPGASDQQASKIQEMQGGYGVNSGPATPEKITVSNGKETYSIDPSHLSDAMRDGFQQVQAK